MHTVRHAGVNPTNAGRQAEQTAYQPNENAYYSAGPNPVYQQPFGDKRRKRVRLPPVCWRFF